MATGCGGAVNDNDDMLMYRRTLLVNVVSHWDLDEADLDEAIRCGLSGVTVRVEHEETLDTSWVPVTVLTVSREDSDSA